MRNNNIILIILFNILVIFSACKQNKKVKEYEIDYLSGSKIEINQYGTQTIEDLATLCKIWGFLKYYHPMVAKGNYNWDFELFEIMPAILNSKSITERNSILHNWINSLGTVESCKAIPFVEKDKVKIYPDIGWINNKDTLGYITEQLNNIKNTNRESNHYISLAPNVGNPVFQNEDDYQQFIYPDTGYRLLALFRYWNMIEYYFPYKYLIGEDWNNILYRFIPQFIEAKNELEYKLALLRLITSINDTHAYIADTTLKKYKGINIAPVEITFVEDKAVVTGFFNTKRSKDSPLEIGDIIVSVNSESIDSIIKRKLDIMPASNDPSKLRNIAKELLRTNGSELYVKYIRNDSIFMAELDCVSISRTHIPSRSQRDVPCYQIIDNDISYIYPGSTIEGSIPDNIKTKGIIIDLRCYPNPNKVKGYWKFDQLFPGYTEFAKFTRGSIMNPGLFIYQNKVSRWEKTNTNYYRGKKIILINEITQSYAEYSTMIYACAPNTIIIGSATAGADGNISKISLPGGVDTMISGIGVYYPDGKETQRIGIIPDIEVKPTIEGIKQARDEVLEKAIEIINQD